LPVLSSTTAWATSPWLPASKCTVKVPAAASSSTIVVVVP